MSIATEPLREFGAPQRLGAETVSAGRINHQVAGNSLKLVAILAARTARTHAQMLGQAVRPDGASKRL